MVVRDAVQESQLLSVATAPAADHPVEPEARPSIERQNPIDRLRLQPSCFAARGPKGSEPTSDRCEERSKRVHVQRMQKFRSPFEDTRGWEWW